MNLLLYMLGRHRGAGAGMRPSGRQSLMAHAALAAGTGDLSAALGAYRTLSDSSAGTPMDVLIRAHLHLIAGEMMEAAIHFAEGVARLSGPGPGGAAPTLERLIERSDRQMADGKYETASRILRRARSLMEVIMAGEAGLRLTQTHVRDESVLALLCRLSDLSLRLLARAQLARQFSDALRERHASRPGGGWATSSERVQALLRSETARLEALKKEFPGHAENQYRLALTARAAGNGPRAAAAFEAVLALHPYHVSSAVRLAVTGGERGIEALRRAFMVPAEALGLFARVAAAADDPGMFDAAAAQLCGPRGPGHSVARGNLAFALSEMALLDESRETWRETAAV
jgi:hypothetical protein